MRNALVIISLLAFLLICTVVLIIRSNRKLAEKTRLEEMQGEQLRRMNEEIQKSTALKLQFFTSVSHEVRTPLTLILAPLEKLANAAKGSEYEQDLSLMQRNGQRLLAEINQMLDFRRLESGSQKVKLQDTPIIQYVQDIKCLFDGLARLKGIRYAVHSDSDPIASETLPLDRTLMEKALVNLLSNAFKYTPEGGEIKVETHNFPDRAEIEVSDSGAGIPAELLPHIFDSFVTDNNASGTGIGLHIVKKIVAMHGGDVTVQSTLGKGSSFRIVLPRNTSAPISEETPEHLDWIPEERDEDTRELLSQRYPINVLVVDDDDDMREYTSRILSENFQIKAVARGREALEWMEGNDVSLVLSDVMMPDMNGFELCDAIKGDIRYCHIPVVLLTALNNDRYKLYGTTAGADAYISKPYSADYVKVSIIKIIENRKALSLRLLKNAENGGTGLSPLPESIDDAFLRKFVSLVEAAYADSSYNIEKLSSDMAMSRGHLARKIKELTGISPIEYLGEFRLKKAMELLKKTSFPISSVAYDCGFTDPAYFTRKFREKYGKTPSEARAAQNS